MERKLPSPVDLLRESWDIFTTRLRTLVAVQLIPILGIIPLLVVLAIGVISDFGGFFTDNSSSLRKILPVEITLPLIVLMLAFVLLMLTLQILSQVALLFAIKDSQEQIGFKEAYKRGWGKLRSYLWATLLAGLAILGGFILFIIPGIIFAVWFGLVGFVVIGEELRGRAALTRSKELVKGQWWGVFGRFLFLGLVALVLFIILSSIELLWQKVGVAWVGEIVSAVIWFFWAPFAVIYSYLIYRHLKELKEAV